jgi:mitochondrial cardiolipin hydrolase
MDEIIAQLKQSLEDDFLSKAERKSIKAMLGQYAWDNDQLNFLRSKVFELANAKANEKNYKFIIEWIKDASSALMSKPAEKSDAYFSPGEACRNVIIQQLNSAIRQVRICVFTISDDSITKAIIGSHKRGVDIRIITDNDKSLDMGSDIEQIAKEKIPVKMDTTSNHMHHKFMLVDNHSLLTGSYNWTSSAARFNHENVLITKEPGVIKSFLKEFEALWIEMTDY